MHCHTLLMETTSNYYILIMKNCLKAMGGELNKNYKSKVSCKMKRELRMVRDETYSR